MLLIATDEAGYGPKLGPLVIGATLWQLPDHCPTDAQSLQQCFAGIKQRYAIRGANVVVDDSKSVFKPSKSKVQNSASDGLETLHATVSVANQLGGNPAIDFANWLAGVAEEDVPSIRATDWFDDLGQDKFWRGDDVDEIVKNWAGTGLQLLDTQLRVIPAAKFNQACAGGLNKADLLSESTLGLVHDLLSRQGDRQMHNAAVFCDRHGGRRYYTGVLQHVFSDAIVQVIRETKSESKYRMTHDAYQATIQFTVKGDSFTPVALSSIYAKYVRERMMQVFNRYFVQHHKASEALVPTAGYPTDADRFLRAIEPIIQSEQIDLGQLVRAR